MVEPGTSLTNGLPLAPVTVAGGNGRFVPGRGLPPSASPAPFDPKIGQKAREDLTPGARSAGSDRARTGQLALSAPQSFAFSASGAAAVFLAQQIAQEMAAEIVPPQQAAAAATGFYRAVPDPYITYAGPQIALDITV